MKAQFGSIDQEAPAQDQVALVYTNTTSTPCTIAGFPGFELVASTSGKMVTYSPPRQGIPPASVLLTPGASAHALFTYDTGPVTCSSDVTPWIPTAVDTIPPDETAELTLPWTGGSINACSDTTGITSAGASIGPVEAGGAPPVPSSSEIAAAQIAAQALYPPSGSSSELPTWESSGVVTSGTNLWLALASQTGNVPVSVVIYLWSESLWASQGTVSLKGFPLLDGGVGDGSVATASLTGSSDPDFIFYGNGADWGSTSVISNAGGSWHAVPFDGQSPATVSAFDAVTGNVIWGEADLCGCATNEPEAFEWFQYSSGEFRPTEPIGPTPPCGAAQFTTLANTVSTTSTTPGSTSSTFAGPVTFENAACDDGWALAKGTAHGAPVVGLFNWRTWQQSRWVSDVTGGVSDLASDPGSFGIPPDLLKALAEELNVALPAVTPSASQATTGALPTAATELEPSNTQFEVEPTLIGLSGDASDIVQDIRWAAWEQSGATGHGIVDIESCSPSCAQGAHTPVPVTIYLNDVVNGKFTLLTEIINGGSPQNFPLVEDGWQRPGE